MRSTRKVCIPLILLLVLLGAGSYWAFAEPVSPDLAQAAAHTFSEAEMAGSAFYWSCTGISEDAVVGEMTPLLDDVTETCLAYVFKIRPVGYVVVSTDTMITPIVAYSYRSDFSWEDVQENILLQMLKLDMEYRLEAVGERLTDLQVVEENEELWEEYLSGSFSKTREGSSTVYGPWVTTQWHQYSPYNDDCPLDPNTNKRCIVGCVATALGQILNYWQYPTAVSFTSGDDYPSSFDPGDGNGSRHIQISANTASFAGLNYNDCSPSNPAKADLCFAAGVSVRMKYSSCASVTHTAKAAPALAGSWYPWSDPPPERWGYVSADLRTHNSRYSWWGSPYHTAETSFYDQLSANMQLAQPAEMAIKSTSTEAGHAIVVDGWRIGRIYHLNYGWGGSNCGWYMLPRGMPADYDVVLYAVLSIIPTATTYSLTVNSTGNGSVSKVPDQSNFTAGTHVILAATSRTGESFLRWEGDLTGSINPAHIIMGENKMVTAVFTSDVSWHIETVDGSGDVGQYTSIAVDGNGYPHISYYDDTNDNLKYARYDGTSWHIETVDSGGSVGRFTSIALDGNDHPHISYYDDTNDNLKYARYDGTSWRIETVDSSSGVGHYTSIALDGYGHPHVSYYDYTNRDLKYARYDGTSWHIETVDSGGSVGWFTSIALGRYGYPHISYADSTKHDLKYAYKDWLGWHIETVDSSGDVGHYTSIALRRYGYPLISYYDYPIITYYGYTNRNFKYACYNGLYWHIETVDSMRIFGGRSSMALDGNGWPHVSYARLVSIFPLLKLDLEHAYQDAAGWHIETVDGGGCAAAPSCSIALDGNGHPHISYADCDNDDLKYAYRK